MFPFLKNERGEQGRDDIIEPFFRGNKEKGSKTKSYSKNIFRRFFTPNYLGEESPERQAA
jgi:hypothetical protein